MSMAKSIKTRETIKDIKVHDTAVSVTDKVKNIGIKTKDTVNENTNQADNVSPEQYATDKVSEAMRTGGERLAVGTEKAVRKGASKVKEKIAEKKANEKSDKTTQPKKETDNANGKQDKPTVKESTKVPPKVKEQTEPNIDEIKKPRQRKQTAPKAKGKATIKKFGSEKQTVKTIGSEVHKIKQSKRSLNNSAKNIKVADNSIKTAKSVSTTTTKSVENTNRAKQVAQKTTRASVKTIKAVAKAIESTGKAVVTGTKSIGTIAVGGVPAIVVIIVICLIGAIGGTCFGIFLANDETTGTQKTMSMAISELTSEHYANLTAMKASYTYDLLEVQGDTSINWKDVLAVYAVKTTSGENPLEVVTLDDTKIDLLRDIMEDMNKMTGVVTPKVVSETTVTTDENGNAVKTTTYVTKKVLTVSILQLSTDEISALYNFDDEQKALLEELMSDEYSDLWGELLGASGQIIQGNSSYVGTGMFAWPFAEDQYISSRFGTRVDPISGEVKTHGGTDIAAPLGTPILAVADGVVVTAMWHNSYGYYVKIKHDDTYSTLYGHCSALHVSAGQTVKQGQVIADCGSTGYSTGPHCHFEVIQNGVRVDALMFYKY